jgi:tetratricopeptide (TPR) repeat protein
MTVGSLTAGEEAQLAQTIEMFEVITQSQPHDCQSLEILKEAYQKLGREKDLVATSKRLAHAYVQLGQLSSAILEYESILQRYPDDPDVLAALGEIESQATSLSVPEVEPAVRPAPGAARSKVAVEPGAPTVIDDGRETMHRLFVVGKLISAGDFDLCWQTPDVSAPPGKALEPFIQLLADKEIVPLEKSLNLLCEKSRLGYLPLEKYDIDLELTRSFPAAICQRWCVLPFDRMSKSIFVATANPFNREAAKELEKAARQRLIFYLSPPPDLLKVIRKLFR